MRCQNGGERLHALPVVQPSAAVKLLCMNTTFAVVYYGQVTWLFDDGHWVFGRWEGNEHHRDVSQDLFFAQRKVLFHSSHKVRRTDTQKTNMSYIWKNNNFSRDSSVHEDSYV